MHAELIPGVPCELIALTMEFVKKEVKSNRERRRARACRLAVSRCVQNESGVRIW